mmetsp:Transcript_21127/g.65651  ORF Transcript_21127/g.65651 Transcript_21127/m.65651 type:complete len:230 (+) Transcript_21127:116-805(+)
MRSALPMLPASTSPVLIPTRTRSSSPASSHDALSGSTIVSRSSSFPASVAFTSWFDTPNGAPHTAMMQSPMYLSIRPECDMTSDDIVSKYCDTSPLSASGGTRSHMLVNPAMSLNSIVHHSGFIAISHSCPDAIRSFTTSRGTYRVKLFKATSSLRNARYMGLSSTSDGSVSSSSSADSSFAILSVAVASFVMGVTTALYTTTHTTRHTSSTATATMMRTVETRRASPK